MSIHKQAFLEQTKLNQNTLEVWLAQEWLLPTQEQNQDLFSEADIARASDWRID